MFEPKRKRQPQRVGGIVQRLLTHLKIKSKENEIYLNTLWREIVGEKVAQHTKPIQIKNHKLWIQAESAAWMNELTFLREKIKIGAKKHLAERGIQIEEVVFKCGTERSRRD